MLTVFIGEDFSQVRIWLENTCTRSKKNYILQGPIIPESIITRIIYTYVTGVRCFYLQNAKQIFFNSDIRTKSRTLTDNHKQEIIISN